MTIAALVGHTGPVALFLGAALEGETYAMLGGMIAHRGLLPLPVAWGAVLLGTLLADQGFFFAGRRLRDRLFVRRIRARAAFAKARISIGTRRYSCCCSDFSTGCARPAR